MHIRAISKKAPAAAVEFEGILFFFNGVLGIINTIVNIGNSAVVLIGNALGLVKP